MTNIPVQLPFEFAKNSPSTLNVTRVEDSKQRPHAVEFVVNVISRGVTVERDKVIIGDSIIDSLARVNFAIIRYFEAKGYLVTGVKGLTRQLGRYNKLRDKHV